MSLKSIQKELGVTADGVLGKQTFYAIKSRYELSTEQTAMFLGQVCHESNTFEVLEENLNYSANGLLITFKKYFTEDIVSINPKTKKLNVIKGTASLAQRNPEAIANKVYANRMGNGNEKSGDGWKHRGFGAIQLTGKEMQYKFADYIGDQKIKENPKLIAEKYALSSAVWFFEKNKLWDICKNVNDSSILALTIKVNGGVNGLEDRKAKTYRYYNETK